MHFLHTFYETARSVGWSCALIQAHQRIFVVWTDSLYVCIYYCIGATFTVQTSKSPIAQTDE